MADFVLVHGAWHGAWCWQRVLAPLWRAGHRAFAVSLTGVGERAHLLGPQIRLATHVEDVVRTIESEELEGALLVAHSYAGMVATGVADRLPARLRRLVYVDAVVPLPGEAWSTAQAAKTQAERRATVASQGVLPPPDPAVFGLQGDDAAWVGRRQTPQPGTLYDDPLHFDAGRLQALPRTYIACTWPAMGSIAPYHQRVKEQGDWQWFELATGHDPMISAPRELLDILLKIAGA